MSTRNSLVVGVAVGDTVGAVGSLIIVTVGADELLWGITDGISDPIDVGEVVISVDDGNWVGEFVAEGTMSVDGCKVSIGTVVAGGNMVGWFVFEEEVVGGEEEIGEVPSGEVVALLGVTDGKSDGIKVSVVADGVGVSVLTVGCIVDGMKVPAVTEGEGASVPPAGCIVGIDGGTLPLGPAIGESVGETGEVPRGEFVILVGVGKSDGIKVSVETEGDGVAVPTVGCIVGTRTLPLGPAIGEPVGDNGGMLPFGAGSGKAVGVKGSIVALGADMGEAVGADGEPILGKIVGRLRPESDGVIDSSINGAILEGDGGIDNKIGDMAGRILVTGATTGAILGMPGTVWPGTRTESRICTIPLQPSVFVARTVALSNLTGSIVTVTERPGSKVSRSPATAFATKCNPGSI